MFTLNNRCQKLSLLAAGTMFSILTLSPVGVRALKIHRVSIPEVVIRGEDVEMRCEYDLEGEDLYSVMWYKGQREFYRYMPSVHPPSQGFPLPEMKIDILTSDDTRVVLRDMQPSLSGEYICEVSTEGPSFYTMKRSAKMTVIVLSRGPPTITGVKPHYRVGNTLHINCTSSSSYPAADIFFYINGNKLEDTDPRIIHYDVLQRSNNLENSMRGLKFQVTSRHLDEPLKVRCMASIMSNYVQSSEFVVHVVERRAAHQSIDSTGSGSPNLSAELGATRSLLVVLSALVSHWR